MEKEQFEDLLLKSSSQMLKAQQIIMDLEEIHSELSGIFKYYKASYENFDFDTDETGKPIDPEFYIYRDLKKVEEILKKYAKK